MVYFQHYSLIPIEDNMLGDSWLNWGAFGALTDEVT